MQQTISAIVGMMLLGACPAGTASFSSSTTGTGGSSGASGGGGGGDDDGGGNLGGEGTLEERKYWRGQMDYLQRSLDYAEEQCGYRFSFEWADRATLRARAEKNNNSPYGICASLVDEVAGICREGADEKAAVAAKIKGFKCSYGNPRTMEFAGNIIDYRGNHEESNFSDWARPWLLKNL